MASLKTSGLQRFVEKILSKFLTKEAAEGQFLTQDDINIQDIAFKSKNVYGSKNTDNKGNGSTATYLPGLVPSASLAYTSGQYLRSDGTWHTPITIVTGQYNDTNSSNHTMTINGSFTDKPCYIELYAPDGTLGMSAYVDATQKVNSVAQYKGNISNITTTQLTAFVGYSNNNGKWTYIVYKYNT